MQPELLHESVDGEWSFIETLRHLACGTDSWIRRAVLGDPSPWDALDLPWDEMPDTPGVPRDRDARDLDRHVLSRAIRGQLPGYAACVAHAVRVQTGD
jgi:hypothetical protein